KVARAGFYPDRAPTAKQRNRVGLFEEARRLAAEIVAIEACELKRILRIVNRFPHERLRALAHEARIRAENKHDRPIRPRKEVLDLEDFQRNHEISRSPASCRGNGSNKRSARFKSGGLGRFSEAAIVRRSRSSDEIGCKPRPDIVGDHFRRAQLSILQSAHACEPLLLAWNV